MKIKYYKKTVVHPKNDVKKLLGELGIKSLDLYSKHSGFKFPCAKGKIKEITGGKKWHKKKWK